MNDSFGRASRIFALLVAGALIALGLPSMFSALSAQDVPGMWWANRSLGLLSYVALWFSVLFGVLLAGGEVTKGLFDRAIVLELHRVWSVASLAITAAHIVLAVSDPHGGVSALALLVPWASQTRTGAIGLGTVASWGLIAIALTTALHARVPRLVWRAVHASAFGSFLLALAHGFAAGTDTASPTVRALYVGTSAVLLAAVLWRGVAAFVQRGVAAASR
jgi:methionine sulfoxide reductase heme-binding subunit